MLGKGTVLLSYFIFCFQANAYWLYRYNEAVYSFHTEFYKVPEYIKSHKIKQVDVTAMTELNGETSTRIIYDKNGFVLRTISVVKGYRNEYWSDFTDDFFRQKKRDWSLQQDEKEPYSYQEEDMVPKCSEIVVHRRENGLLDSVEYKESELNKRLVYSYDSEERLVRYSEVTADNGERFSDDFLFTYDQKGRIFRMDEPKYQNGKYTTYKEFFWDDKDRLTKAIAHDEWNPTPDTLNIKYKDDTIFMTSYTGNTESITFYYDYIYVINKKGLVSYMDYMDKQLSFKYKFY